MTISPFRLEEFWKKYEFTSPYLLCCSDAETCTLSELLAIADEDSKKLWNSLALGYTESTGHPTLRQEIAHLYHSNPTCPLNSGPDLIRQFRWRS